MPARPVAVDHRASLCPVASLMIGVVAEPSDEGVGIGPDGRATSFRDRSQVNRLIYHPSVASRRRRAR